MSIRNVVFFLWNNLLRNLCDSNVGNIICANIVECFSIFFGSANGRKVVLGIHSLSEAENTKQTFDILELYNHPDFSIENYDNDIALIKVSFHLFLALFELEINQTKLELDAFPLIGSNTETLKYYFFLHN